VFNHRGSECCEAFKYFQAFNSKYLNTVEWHAFEAVLRYFEAVFGIQKIPSTFRISVCMFAQLSDTCRPTSYGSNRVQHYQISCNILQHSSTF